MKIPVTLRFSTGRTLVCETIDYSEGGVGVVLPDGIQVPQHESVTVLLQRGQDEYAFPATVGFTEPGRVGLRFASLTREQEFELVRATFARADAWTDWADGREPDTPLRALAHVLRIGVQGIGGLFVHLYGDIVARRAQRRRSSPLNAINKS
jgi:cellulose synthase (UDP-forming)